MTEKGPNIVHSRCDSKGGNDVIDALGGSLGRFRTVVHTTLSLSPIQVDFGANPAQAVAVVSSRHEICWNARK
jgi:hypothetical protein